MSRLFIAEKPSLGRAIAAALPKPHKNKQGFIECGNGDTVTWCIGHLLEQVEPDVYDDKYQKWSLEHLPIVPLKWLLRPRKSASKQLTVVRKLLKSSDQIIHAGDPDREGQLLVDEVIDYCKVSQSRKQKIQRLLISDLNLTAVKKALNNLKSNQDYIPLSVSALARSRADWLYGMNMTRAYTLLGQKAGYSGVLSVGRVQTPVLGLVVRRDLEIENFQSKPYFTLDAFIPFQSSNGEEYDIKARWKPSEACKPWQDEEGRVLNRKLVENVASRIIDQPAVVTLSEQKVSKQNPPLPYSLSALQIDAAKRFNLSAQQVLDGCQSLYEKHKLITYPRSDSRHLPKDHLHEAQAVIKAIENNDSSLTSAVTNANLSLKSYAWNDKKVEAHHAIIPTPKHSKSAILSKVEQNIYQLIARQYLMQFYPAAQYADSKLEFDIAGGLFVSKGRVLLESGWKVLITTSAKTEQPHQIPAIDKGSALICKSSQILDKHTEPPKAFTEASLLQAMTGIARFVSDHSLKAILKETDGLGTEATRAGILDTLFKRNLLTRNNKNINSTLASRALIEALPLDATYPDMTANWEHQLKGMSLKQYSYTPFMQNLESKITEIIKEVKSSGVPSSLLTLPKGEGNKTKFKRKRRKSFSSKRKSSAK
jgi:DNA topoisomerase-3